MKKITIIGAGIVGLATALKLLEKDPNLDILILEKEDSVSKHQTGNNSGVIHSGIYYKPGSLKAKNCRRGYELLLDFADKHKIKYDICGKVIVATNLNEIEYLETLFDRGRQNGLENLKILSKEELKEYEPNTNGIKGIFVPQTGIIDYKEVSNKYREEIEAKGSKIQFNEKVINIIEKDGLSEVITNKGKYESDLVISCGGLQSDILAKMTNPDLPFRIIPFRGEYYKLKAEKRDLIKSLIYPVPDPNFPFLGVHFTNMINGEVEAGPNAVFSFKREGYSKFSFSLKDSIGSLTWPGFLKVAKNYWKVGFGEFYRSFSKTAFVKSLNKLVPSVKKEDLEKGGAGIRAQACSIDGKLIDDFYFVEGKRSLHVCNAPSPAATASLAIGEKIADRVFQKFH